MTSNSIPRDTTLETGLPKSYSNRVFVASFKADPELWSRFKGECALRGVSICHVLEALMEAWIQGQKATATVVKPVIVNLTMQHVVERPRRKKIIREPWEIARSQRWPPNCDHVDDFIRGTKEVGCLDLQEWVLLEKCWRCYLGSRVET